MCKTLLVCDAFKLPQAALKVKWSLGWSVGQLHCIGGVCEKVTFTTDQEYQIVTGVTVVKRK